jgi:beta-lactam-binding protein with PASTA domain
VRETARARDGIALALTSRMRTAWMWVMAAGCSMASKVVTVGPKSSESSESASSASESASESAAPPSESKQLTMPDLQGMTADQAKAALASAGFTGSLLTDEGICDDDAQAPHLHVCAQSPDAGGQQASESPVHVVLNQESPESNQPGVPGAHYAMPDLIGLSVAQVKAKLGKAGFSQADNFSVHVDGDCDKPGLVCHSDPAPGTITTTRSNKILHVGQSKEIYFDFMLFE